MAAKAHVLSRAIDLNAPPLAGRLLPGATWNFQAWFRDPGAGSAGFNSSTALSILVEP
jgi:hypothetical protein